MMAKHHHHVSNLQKQSFIRYFQRLSLVLKRILSTNLYYNLWFSGFSFTYVVRISNA